MKMMTIQYVMMKIIRMPMMVAGMVAMRMTVVIVMVMKMLVFAW
jgi:hypothetical protein